MNDIARLLVKHIPQLRRYARALTGDSNRADDLVQDSLERAWSRIHLWRGQGDMRAWLFTIMHNVFANTVRAYTRQPTLVAINDNEIGALDRREGELSIELRDLQTAIDKLPENQREVILLVGLEQLGYQEVATALGIPIGTVMSRLARARENLRKMLHQPKPRRQSLRRVK